MLLTEHRGPLAADMVRYYSIPLSRVRERVTLWEFAAMAAHLPRGSSVWRAVNGEARAEWGLNEQLLAVMANALHWLQWAQTKDGERGRNRPVPILPPWEEDEAREVQRFGAEPVPLDELDAFLGL